MNKNIKIALIILGIILLGGLIVLAVQEPSFTEEVINEEELEVEKLEDLIIDEELEDLTNEEINEEVLEENKNDEVAITRVVEEEKTINDFIQCLKEKGVVIYGSEWCPHCKNLAESLGGYDVVDPIYVECTVEKERCSNEMIGRGVPEIQIDGVMYGGSRDPEKIAEETGCVYYQ